MCFLVPSRRSGGGVPFSSPAGLLRWQNETGKYGWQPGAPAAGTRGWKHAVGIRQFTELDECFGNVRFIRPLPRSSRGVLLLRAGERPRPFCGPSAYSPLPPADRPSPGFSSVLAFRANSSGSPLTRCSGLPRPGV